MSRIDKNTMAASRVILLVVLGLVGLRFSIAQSESDFAKRYTPVHAYLLRPGIIMFAQFDTEGQVCRITVQRKEDDSLDQGTLFSGQLADEIVDQLVPAPIRGKPLGPYLNSDSYVTGGSFFLKKDFENLSVEKMGDVRDSSTDSIRIVQIIWRNRSCR